MKRAQLAKYFDFSHIDGLNNEELTQLHKHNVDTHGTTHINTRATKAVMVERALMVSDSFNTRIANAVGKGNEAALDRLLEEATEDVELAAIEFGYESIAYRRRANARLNELLTLFKKGHYDAITEQLRAARA